MSEASSQGDTNDFDSEGQIHPQQSLVSQTTSHQETWEHSIQTASVTKLMRWLRMANMANAIILGIASVVNFILLGGFSPSVFLMSLYVMFFSCTLCCFELHFRAIEVIVRRYFAFMFMWQGRMFYLIFIGTLAFGLGIIGIIAGILTFVNVFFNVYAIRINSQLKSEMEKGMVEIDPNASIKSHNQQLQTDDPSVDVNMDIGGHNVTVPITLSTALAVGKVAGKAAVTGATAYVNANDT